MGADYCGFCGKRVHWHDPETGDANKDAKVVVMPDRGVLIVCGECVDKPLLVDRETGEDTTFRAAYA